MTASIVAQSAKSLRFELRSLSSRHGLLHAPLRGFNRWRHPEGQVYVDDQTDLLIDGYQGSANTFAVRCFRSAQRQPVRIAHHCHAPEQVRAAVRRHLPIMITLREPIGAVRSTIRRWPAVDPRTALRGYVRYYEAVESLADAVFIADFVEVTADFGVVIDAFNERFGTGFDRFEHTPQSARIGYDPPPHRVDAIVRERDEAGRRLEASAGGLLLSRAVAVHGRMLDSSHSGGRAR